MTRLMSLHASIRRAARSLGATAQLCALVAAASLMLVAARGQADEDIFLQSGEQYQCTIEGISGGALDCRQEGKRESFPLDKVQRIEFEKAREFDGLDSTGALSNASPLFAAALALKTDDLKKAYPQAGDVIISSETVLKTADDGTYSIERTTVWRILDQRAADTSFQALYFLPDYQTASVLFGITVGPDGKVERVSDGAMKVEAVYPSYPEYNHEQRLRFAMKNPVPGATLFLRTEKTGKATDLVPAVIDETFWSDQPALERVVRIEAAGGSFKNIAVATSGGLTADQSGTVFAVKNTPQIFFEPAMPPVANFAPRVLVSFPASNWETLAREFAARVEVKPIASPAGTTLRDVYNRVRRDVRLVGVPLDALPTPPAAPAEVLKRGYGVETEKALLLQALLEGLGAKASTVLVHGRGSADFPAAAPRLHGFNYSLVRLESTDGTVTWLQPDINKRGFGELSQDAQGGKGLDLTSGALCDVPVLQTGADGSVRAVDVTLEPNGAATVKDTTTASGADAASLRRLGDLSEDELQKWAAQEVGGSLPGVTLTSFTHSDFNKVNAEESISFVYRVPDLAQRSGDFLVMKLPNAKYAPGEVGRSIHQYDLFWLGRDSEDVSFTVHGPADYRVYAAGRSADKSGDGWKLVSGYSTPKFEPDVVQFTEKWTREAVDAPKASYPQYRDALITRGVLRNEMIAFEGLPIRHTAQTGPKVAPRLGKTGKVPPQGPKQPFTAAPKGKGQGKGLEAAKPQQPRP